MYGYVLTLLHKLRFISIAAFIIADLFLISLLPAALGPAHAQQTARSQNAASAFSVSPYENPNAMSAALTSLASNASKAITSAGYTAGTFSRSILMTAGRASLAVLKGLCNGIIFAARAVGAAVAFTVEVVITAAAFTVRVPGNILGFISSTASASPLTRPSASAQLPVINPKTPVTTPPTAPLQPVQSAAVAASTKASTEASWPIHGTITTLFGVPHWPYQPVHTGIDVSSGRRSGVTPVTPFKLGRVISTVHSGSGLGNHIVIDHGDGVISTYGHLASIAVHTGQDVTQGTILGYEGSTGASTGTHLHFEIRVHGQMVDPLKYIGGQP